MRVKFDFFSEPILLESFSPTVVVIENKSVFREVLRCFEAGEVSESIVFSKQFEPIAQKNNVCFIPGVFHLSLDTAFYKKVYSDMGALSSEVFFGELSALNAQVVAFLEQVVREFDFDFAFQETLDPVALFKMQSVRAVLQGEDLLERLSEYILLVQKYTGVQCFVAANLHLVFEAEELCRFYAQMRAHGVRLLLLEAVCFEKIAGERRFILDSDFCEIVENE